MRKIIEFYNKVQAGKKGSDLERTSHDKIRKVLYLLEEKLHGILLDIGCGNGSITKLIAKRTNSEVIGIDISINACKDSKAKGLQTLVCDAEMRLPFRNGSIDHIFAGSVIEHVFDVDSFLDEIKRVLKPHGYCMLTTSNLGWMPNRLLLLLGLNPIFTESSFRYDVSGFWAKKREDVAAGHLHLFTLRALIKLLELNQLAVEEVIGSRILEGAIIKRLGQKGLKFKIFSLLDRLFCLFPSTSAELIVKLRKLKNGDRIEQDEAFHNYPNSK